MVASLPHFSVDNLQRRNKEVLFIGFLHASINPCGIPVHVAGCKVFRKRFRGLGLHLYLPIPSCLWPQQFTGHPGSQFPSGEWIGLSEMISDNVCFLPLLLIQVPPCVLTLPEHCVTWGLPEMDNFIYEGQWFAFHLNDPEGWHDSYQRFRNGFQRVC